MAQTIPDPETGNQDEQRPDWLPERFKSAEELAKSWSEAEKRITELGQEKSAMEQSLAELAEQFESFQQQQQASHDPYDTADPFIAQATQAWEMGDMATYQRLQDQRAAQIAAMSVQQFAQAQQQQNANTVAFNADQILASKYQDWGEMKVRIAEEIQQHPYLVPDEALASPLVTADALDRVYKMVKADDYASGTAQQQQQSRQSEEARRLADLAPQGAGRIMSPAESQAEWERIKNAGAKSPWTR